MVIYIWNVLILIYLISFKISILTNSITHYVEVNKYGEEVQPNMYAKLSLKSISSLKDKPIFNKIKSFLAEYGIPYNIHYPIRAFSEPEYTPFLKIK